MIKNFARSKIGQALLSRLIAITIIILSNSMFWKTITPKKKEAIFKLIICLVSKFSERNKKKKWIKIRFKKWSNIKEPSVHKVAEIYS